MLSFKALTEKKKTEVKVNPKKDELLEAPRKKDMNHGEDCDCKICEAKRKGEEVHDGPDTAKVESVQPLNKTPIKQTAYDSHQEVSEESNQEECNQETSILRFSEFNEENRLNEGHYGSDVNKIPKELDKAVELHKSQAERLRKSPEFKKDAGKTANQIPDQLDKAVAMHTKQAKQLRDAGVGDKNCGCGNTPCKTYGMKKESLLSFAEATRLKKEKGYDKGGTRKPTGPKQKDTALDLVKKSITAKYGKGAIMSGGSRQQKKVKGQKDTRGTGKFKKAADAKKQTAADAKKRGFKSTQNYVDTMARYGGKDNYDKGRGLGT